MTPKQGRKAGMLLAIAGIIIAAWYGPYQPDELAIRPVTITDGADVSFMIEAEVADTPTLRNQGLMERESLPDNGGMLFTWPNLPSREIPAGSGFWMKNTPLPLTIIFAHQGEIIHIVRRAEPHSLTSLRPADPHQPVDAVLEIAADHPRADDIQIGWQLSLK